jgi:hypothetical protein
VNSDRERGRLLDIERRFQVEDPKFAQSLHSRERGLPNDRDRLTVKIAIPVAVLLGALMLRRTSCRASGRLSLMSTGEASSTTTRP